MVTTVGEIKKAMAILADIIETSPHGEKYWPIFERLERELAVKVNRAERLAAAKAAVNDII
ncbi:hypothetical protein [Rhizobium sullae]|uniref:Uncharacterized protein n=1 Tax=Rhizobium sullae TaxID=50338 RepID=A0A4R3QD92_RHISU|nr:hypothetical protein [Rhizobium sullae]TCU18804.1 hypothetical protein EV132_10231 [Rhizobium sullae]